MRTVRPASSEAWAINSRNMAAGGGVVVLALIEKDAGLLAAQQVGAQVEAVHVDGHRFRHFARQHGGFERQLFLGANGHVIAGHDMHHAMGVGVTDNRAVCGSGWVQGGMTKPLHCSGCFM